MASKAYLDLLKEIPKNIQNNVVETLAIANEIHLILEKQGKSHADLARLLNKSESEISKWLTGTHNFTLKTINKISEVLGEKVLITQSSKIDHYEKEITRLKCKVNELNEKLDGDFIFVNIDSYPLPVFKVHGVGSFYNFHLNKHDPVKVKAETMSSYEVVRSIN